mmetsp:Transcript_19966/g.28288  ORF Transcript_19966/g.28288 Transcript_19966/m.28288 type:complete len:458 (-) Transcript_19966:1565-2938(-)
MVMVSPLDDDSDSMSNRRNNDNEITTATCRGTSNPMLVATSPATTDNNTNISTNNSGVLQWSEIDKVKFYGIGTVMYSTLTLMLHPITVLKTRQQVLSSSSSSSNNSNSKTLQHQPSFRSTLRDVLKSSSSGGLGGVSGLFRGVGIVVALAVPARIIYIGVLENTRHEMNTILMNHDQKKQKVQEEQERLILQSHAGPEEAHSTFSYLAGKSSTTATPSTTPSSWMASMAGGLAGGIAAVSAQILVVPMDVISQKQMIMKPQQYSSRGSALSVVQDILRTESGWKGLYRGFGLSMFNSLPAGSIWWATYSGCQHWIQPHVSKINISGGSSSTTKTTETSYLDMNSIQQFIQKSTTQLFAGISAAIVAATMTQPLDVVKTRLQVGKSSGATIQNSSSSSLSAITIAKDLFGTSGIRGFFRGLGPRILHMGLWGTVLSSAYEVLRHVSRIKEEDDHDDA